MKKTPFIKLFISLFVLVLYSSMLFGTAIASTPNESCLNSSNFACLSETRGFTALSTVASTYYCGGNNDPTQPHIQTSIDFGCSGKGNPILDLAFAIIRFLSDGVGIVVIASVIVGGIQYTTSSGDPNASAKAVARIRAALLALVIFIFAYAILNYVLPGVFLK
jgi:hypothetical protein